MGKAWATSITKTTLHSEYMYIVQIYGHRNNILAGITKKSQKKYLAYYALLRESTCFQCNACDMMKNSLFFLGCFPINCPFSRSDCYSKWKWKKSRMARNFSPSNFIAAINTLIFWSPGVFVDLLVCLYRGENNVRRKTFLIPLADLIGGRREVRLARWHISASRVDMVSSNPPNIRWANLKKYNF